MVTNVVCVDECSKLQGELERRVATSRSRAFHGGGTLRLECAMVSHLPSDQMEAHLWRTIVNERLVMRVTVYLPTQIQAYWPEVEGQLSQRIYRMVRKMVAYSHNHPEQRETAFWLAWCTYLQRYGIQQRASQRLLEDQSEATALVG